MGGTQGLPGRAGTWPSDTDDLPRQAGDPPGWHVREKTEDGYPLMGSSPAEAMDSAYQAARAREAVMRKHSFVGDGPYCESWGAPRSSGDPATTGVVTMGIQCGWSREMHPEKGENT